MKDKKMKLGVLAGLMAAPVASVVTVSANENIEAETLEQIDVTQKAVNISNLTVASTTPPTASFDPADVRLAELLNLKETTVILDIAKYTTILNDLNLDVNDTKEAALKNLLTAKITYLGNLDSLKKEAEKLNAELSLLKTTNADTIEATAKYEQRYVDLQAQFLTNREALDAAIKQNTPALSGTTYIDDAVDHMDVYKGTIEEYVLTQVPSYTTLQTFQADIVEPQRLLNSKDTTTTDAVTVSIGGNDVEINFKEFITLTELNDDATRKKFRTQYEAIKLYLDTKMMPNSKMITESHVLASGQKVGDLLKAAGDDIAGADKVLALIEAMDNTEFKSESTFISKVKAINTAYNKLTERGRQLVTTYETKVEKQTNGGLSTGYMAAEEVINTIKSLKPAATQTYRDALVAASADVATVAPAFQKYIINKSKLAEYSAAVNNAIAVETLINNLDNSGITTADINNAREKYKALSAAEKKVLLKDVYAKLQAWEKTAKASVKVDSTISKIKIENKKTFATNVEKAEKQFNDLGSSNEQELVANRDRLTLISGLAKITGQYYSLKLNNSPEYRQAVRDVYTALNGNKSTLTNAPLSYATMADDVVALEKLYDSLWELVQPKYAEVTSAETVEVFINDAKAKTGPDQLAAIKAARVAYDNLDKNAKKIVNNLKTLTELEKAVKTPEKVQQQIIDVVPSSTSFESKAKSAVGAYDKLTSSQKAYIHEDAQKMVTDYKVMLDFIAQMKAIKVSNAGYRNDVTKAKERLTELKDNVFTSSKKQELVDSLLKYENQLKAFDEGIGRSDIVVQLIADLPSKTGKPFLDGIEVIESEYSQLSSEEKKLVTNYASFQKLKKDSATASKVVDLVNNPIITNKDVANINFEKVMKAAITAYEKLTSTQRAYVYNYGSRVEPLLKVYDLAVMVNKIKPSSKSYREDVNAARALFDQLTPNEQAIAAPLLAKIEGSESGIAEVQKVMDLINEAVPGSENFVEKLKAARDAYDRLATLNSSYQKLVLNYKLLQEREKAIGPVTSSIYEIKELELIINRPFNDPTDFVKKYQAAMKAYEKIPFESRPLVTNREVLLKVIYPVASTLEAIMNIKETSKTFGPDVLRAREMYDQLSASDKALITNYNKLVEFEQVVKGGAVVDEMIREIPTYSGTGYTQAIKDARAAYDQLTPGEKRAVSLYAQLQAYEKGVKNVMTAIDLIDALQFSSNLVSAYDKAQKALDKLTADQRQMVGNLHKLTAVAPAIEVFKMIDKLKPGSEGYSGSVQAAYAAYNRLSNAEKQYVTNFSELQEAKNNVDTLNAVIAKIKEIEPGSRNYGTQVQEALALYNSLPAAVKKLVTNYDVLKEAQSELNAVEKVRSLIAEIDNESATFAEKVMAARAAYDKLTTTQKRLVSNYFMLEDYERELGTMF